MKKTMVARLLMASVVVCTGLLFGNSVKADAAELTVKTDVANAKVDAVISDAAMNGKNASVVCYAPGWNGNVADWNANKNYISYMGQVKVNGATNVSFRLKENVPANGNYTLIVSATGAKLSSNFNFYTAPIVVSDTVEPVKATQSAAAKVKITWNNVNGATKYTVYRATKKNGKYSKIGTSAKTSYVDKKVKAGRTYYYKVAADGKGKSAVVKVTLMKAPKLKVKSVKKPVVLTWKKDNNASGYRVYMASKKKGKYKLVSTLKGKKKVKTSIKKVKKGKTYFFKVSAYKTAGKKKIAGKASAVKKVVVK